MRGKAYPQMRRSYLKLKLPKLKIGEIELNYQKRQCLDSRIPDQKLLYK